MDNTAETDLLYSFQQSMLDERRWFDLYVHLINYSEPSPTTAQNPTPLPAVDSVLFDTTIELKEQLLSQWRLFNHVFDSLPFSILFLDEHYQILHYNKKATALYYQEKFQQFLNTTHQTQSRQKNHQTKPPTDCTEEEYRTLVWENGIHSYYLSVLAYHDHPQVKHIVYAYRNKPQLNPATLSQLFALTESECRTLQAILDYNHSKIACQQLAISHETARTHLKKIMQKTDTHTQSELIMKLFLGGYWLGETQSLHQFDNQENKQLLNDLVQEPFVLLGNPPQTQQTDSGSLTSLTLVIPSFFGVVWDFIEEKGHLWQQWCNHHDRPILIINTHQIIPKSDWKTQDLPTLCQTLATHLQDYLNQFNQLNQLSQQPINLTIIGIHTGAGFALNLPQFLPYPIVQIKLVSPILPLPYMTCEQIPHPEYQNAGKAQKSPKKIWHAIMPHVIEGATKDTQTYFQKRLEYQLHEIDRQKVRRWLSHPYLGEMFANHCKLAKHKIAFDVLLLESCWYIPTPPCPVICYAGRQDIYTCLDSLNALAQDFEQVEVVVFEEEYYSLSTEAWQTIFGSE